jgi:hypothetical protein
VVGFGAGGAYDLYARLTQKLLGRHLPGAPTVIVENMTGAGSLTAANHLAEAAAKDGTVIGTFGAAVVLQQAVGASGGAVKFEPRSLPWLGSPAVITDQCMVKSATGIDSLDRLIASPKGVVFGASAFGNNTAVLPSVMKYYLNDKLKVVTGYDGIAAIKVAVERGELDAACGSWEGLRASYAEWLQASPPYAKVLVKARPDPEQQLREVPELGSRLPSEEARQVLALAEAPSAAGFVFATTPGVPETRLKALRLAVLETWQDPEFSADAQRANLAVAPQDAATVARALSDITSASPELLQTTKEVLGIQ